MQTKYISHSYSPQLIILFMGWGMDSVCIKDLHREGCDILAVYDYSGLENEQLRNNVFNKLASEYFPYKEVIVIAWSYGVRIATDFLISAHNIPITLTIAINGTPAHIHNDFGIPAQLFQGTLDNLSDRNVWKFQRRMFTDSEQFNIFYQHKPARTLDSLKTELQSFNLIPPIENQDVWDIAIISDSDNIFPTASQKNFWQSTRNYILPNCGHFPDFQDIIERYTRNKSLVCTRFSAANATYIKSASVQRHVAEKLWTLIEKTFSISGTTHNQPKNTPTPIPDGKIVEIGAGFGVLTNLYVNTLSPNHIIELWDLMECPEKTGQIITKHNCKWQQCDAETLMLRQPDNSIAMILSSSTIQWFQSPERFILEAYRALMPNGIAAIALYGESTFHEIAKITGVSLPYPSAQDFEYTLKNLDATECAVIHTDTEIIEFESASSLLSHLKHTGVNGVSQPNPAKALQLARGLKPNAQGKFELTYSPIYILFKK